MKISEEDKKLVLRVQQIFPEVWVFLQREANRGTRWADVMVSLKELLKVGDEITVPWGFLEWKLKEIERNRDQRRIDKETEERQKRKFKEKEDLMGLKLGDLIKGVGE